MLRQDYDLKKKFIEINEDISPCVQEINCVTKN